jgi:hypothetical protein
MMLNETNWKGLGDMAERKPMIGVAVYGALSELNHKNYLESLGYNVVENDSGKGNVSAPDFVVNGILMEHKRARSKNWANGDFKTELQRTRSKSDRLYDFSWTDVFAVDISRHTGIPNDYRYKKAIDLEPHPDFPEKIYPHVRIDDTWKKTLKEIIGVDDES